ncbi:MAG: hypothetical protein ACR2IF_13505 [Terriglobales bacterium]
MRKHITCLVLLAILLFALGAMAQTSSSSQTTTTTTTTTTGPSRTIEGCIIKEASDFFLVPAHGNPIELQASAGQDLNAHEGHKVKINGVESALSATNTSATVAGTAGAAGVSTSASTAPAGNTGAISSNSGAGSQGSAGVSTGTGNDLHKLATQQMSVAKLTHVSETCPVNWNPNVSTKK